MATKLTDLTLNRVALVDRPANKGARILMWKRDGGGDGEMADWTGGKSLASKFAKLFGFTKDGTKVEINPATVTDHIDLDIAVKALLLTLKDVDGDKKAMAKAAEDFLEYVADADEATVSAALGKAGFQLVDGSIEKKENDMASAALKKSLGLKDDATDADVEKAVSDLALANKRAESVAKMSPSAKAHYDTLDKAAQPAMADMTAEEQDECAATAGKKKTSKSAEQEIVEKAQKDAADARAEVAKLRDERELDTVIKRVSVMKFVGKPDDIGAMIHKAAKIDKAFGEQLETTLKALNTQLEKSALFSESGSSRTGPVGKAFDAIGAAAAELMKKDSKLTLAKARMLARQSNPELAKQEEEEAKEARRSAA